MTNRFFVIAAALLAFGFTLTAQTSARTNGMFACRAMLPENYPLLPDEIRDLAGKGAMACTATVDERIAAQEKLDSAANALNAAIADKQSSVVDILRLKLDYLDAFVGIHAADQMMHKPNFEASMKYFDLVIARKKAGISLDDATQDAYGKWQTAMLAAENHVGPDKTLLEKATEAEKDRMAIEDAQFKEVNHVFEEMLKRDAEMMKRMREKQ